MYSGAVTSPTVLPSSSRVVSHGIGRPRSSRSDMQMSHNLTGSDNDCSLFFDKEKHGNETHGHLEDCDAEAEAEAAASAVAVAAISSDEIVGNGLGACSVPASDGKSFVAADIDRVVAGESSLSVLLISIVFLSSGHLLIIRLNINLYSGTLYLSLLVT